MYYSFTIPSVFIFKEEKDMDEKRDMIKSR